MSAWQQHATDTVSPVWVFVAQPTQFERLLRIVHERQGDGRLFYRVSNEGRPLDLQLLRLLLGPDWQPPGYSAATRPSFHPEAKIKVEPDPKHTGPHNPEEPTPEPTPPEPTPPEPTSPGPTPPEPPPPAPWTDMPNNQPHFAREARPYRLPDPSYRADNTSNSRPPPIGRPDEVINVKKSVVYGVAVDSLMGEFLLHLHDPPARGRFLYY